MSYSHFNYFVKTKPVLEQQFCYHAPKQPLASNLEVDFSSAGHLHLPLAKWWFLKTPHPIPLAGSGNPMSHENTANQTTSHLLLISTAQLPLKRQTAQELHTPSRAVAAMTVFHTNSSRHWLPPVNGTIITKVVTWNVQGSYWLMELQCQELVWGLLRGCLQVS